MAQPRIIPIEIEPLRIKTSDGKERKFLLTAGGMNRLKTRFEVKTLQELAGKGEEVSISILYEALIDKTGITEAEFADVMPFHPKSIAEAIAALLGVSMPEPTPNPTPALTTEPGYRRIAPN